MDIDTQSSSACGPTHDKQRSRRYCESSSSRSCLTSADEVDALKLALKAEASISSMLVDGGPVAAVVVGMTISQQTSSDAPPTHSVAPFPTVANGGSSVSRGSAPSKVLFCSDRLVSSAHPNKRRQGEALRRQ